MGDFWFSFNPIGFESVNKYSEARKKSTIAANPTLLLLVNDVATLIVKGPANAVTLPLRADKLKTVLASLGSVFSIRYVLVADCSGPINKVSVSAKK